MRATAEASRDNPLKRTWLLTMATCAAVWAMLPWLATRVGLGAEAGVLAGLAGSLVPRWPGLHGEGLAAAAMEVMDRQQGHVHVHPRALEGEARKVQELGEVAYMRRAGREALVWIRAHPGRFLELTASRAAHWWLGPQRSRSWWRNPRACTNSASATIKSM